jgi:hypothetical protein
MDAIILHKHYAHKLPKQHHRPIIVVKVDVTILQNTVQMHTRYYSKKKKSIPAQVYNSKKVNAIMIRSNFLNLFVLLIYALLEKSTKFFIMSECRTESPQSKSRSWHALYPS